MELKPNMYVRTEYGIIEKVNNIYDRHTTDNIIVWLNAYGDGKSVFIDDFEEFKFQSINTRGFIKKEPSFNLIDLIEVGDYVNGTKVTSISGTRYDKSDLHCYCDYCQNEKTGKWLMIPAKDIKSIVTKEQMKSIEYKVEEDR